MVKQISESDLKRIILRVVTVTYFNAIVEATPKKTTATADNWDIEIQGDNIVIFNEEYGDIVLFLEEGTGLYGPKKKKYLITPKNKKALNWQHNGKEIFAKKVLHPGIKARHFIQKVLLDKDLEEEFDKVLEEQLVKYFQ